MKRSNAPTLQDVAREADSTAMAASVVLNGARSSARVSEATRARILEAAARLRYRPNAVARGLSRRMMNTIGVVSVIDTGEINLYFHEVLNGILSAAVEHHQNTTLFSLTDWKADEPRILEFCDGRVDGMIFMAPHHLPVAFIEALRHHTPFVMIHGSIDLPDAYNLEVDNEGGAYLMMEHLFTLGHRRIAHFPGSAELLGAQQRLAGYRRALQEAGIPYDDSLVAHGHFSIQSGRERMLSWLEQRPTTPLPTAIFCASDAIAYGCMEALSSHGIRVPEDISIAGFDDTLTARMTTPPLTTIRQPFRLMGRRAVELLLPQIHAETEDTTDSNAAQTPDEIGTASNAESTPLAHTEICPVEIVVRASAAPPPEQPVVPAALHRS